MRWQSDLLLKNCAIIQLRSWGEYLEGALACRKTKNELKQQEVEKQVLRTICLSGRRL